MWQALAGAALGYLGQREANDANRDIARDATNASNLMSKDQMAFQERMSNTAHQRQMADLRAAGLNPLLAGTGGASVPTGAAGEAKTAHMENAIGAGLSTAQSVIAAKQQIEKQEADIGLIRDQQENTKMNTKLADANAKKAAMDTAVTAKGIPKADITNRIYNWANDMFKRATDTNAKTNYKTSEQKNLEKSFSDVLERRRQQMNKARIKNNKPR